MPRPSGEIDPKLLGTVLVSTLCGAFFGYGYALARSVFPQLSRGGPALAAGVPPQNGRANGKLVPSEDESSDSDESITEGGADEDLTKVVAGPSDACKLVLVVRTDLGMSNGKIAAQCSHATLSCYKAVSKANPALLRAWEREGQAKIALQCKSEDDMLLLQAQAQSLGLCARVVQDAGRTQIAAGSRTVLGIGPAPVKEIDKVTKHLRLL